ncbi:MAG: NAD(+) synthase [Bacteroidales bacterium]|nr:NAD(+) synthase [Bacteroidales bacterium]
MTENYGFIRVSAAMPAVRLADTRANAESVCRLIDKAEEDEVSLIAFPELCVTGYTCGDLFGNCTLLSGAKEAILAIARHTEGKSITAVIGAPVEFNDRLYNCAIVASNGKIAGIVPKIWLPSYNEFYESRWFASGKDFLGGSYAVHPEYGCPITPNQTFSIGGIRFGIEICEDLWTPVPPSSYHCLSGAQLIVNLSASNEVLGKHAYRRQLVCQQSARTISGYIYCSAGYGESTQDLVYAGSSMICENGAIMCENERFLMEESMITTDIDCGKLSSLRRKSSTFSTVTPDGHSGYLNIYRNTYVSPGAATDFYERLLRHVPRHPFVPGGEKTLERCSEIISIQVTGLASRLAHINCRSAVIGISGGLDSTLALLVTVLAFDRLGWSRKRIIGITMPGYGTTDRTRSNAEDLMDMLGITSRKISITAACDQHFKDICHDREIHDVTYENSQARERTQILMDVANQAGGIVVGTGDLSELALGWATYNGDHMSMYAVNASVPKTLVRHLVQWAADNRFDRNEPQEGKVHGTAAARSVKAILLDIIDTPISPELLPADENGNIQQVTEDLVGPYELHDFFLYHFFRFGYSPEKILFLAKKAFCQKAAEDECIYDEATVEKWLRTFIRRFFSQQFKRSCLPDGPKVGSVTLSPRGDWRMPSDAKSSGWL